MGPYKSPSRRALTPDERLLWQEFTGDVKRLSGKASQKLILKPENKKTVLRAQGDVRVSSSHKTQGEGPPAPLNLGRNTGQRLTGGQLKIGRRLDLHGLTLDEAYVKLQDVIETCATAGVRVVLVITGKGRGGEGALKQKVPRWLDLPPLRTKVSAIAPAQAKHGGEGALYVLLRRKREDKKP